MISILELWVTILAFEHLCAVLCLIEVELVLDEDVLAEVAREVVGALNFHHVVNSLVKKILWCIGEVLVVKILIAILVNRDHIDL